MMRLVQRIAAATLVAAFGAALATSQASAQYPDKPIRMVVPFAAGSSNDTRARIVAPTLSELLGQPIVVENMPGGGAIIGIDHVLRSAPDGYTLLFTAGAVTLLPVMKKSIPWDPFTDIVPVAILGGSINGLAVNAELGVDDFAEFVELAKADPGALNAAVSGNSSEIATHMLMLRTGTQFELIPYDGTGEAATAVVSGETDFTLLDSAAFLPLLDTGRLKVLAITNPERIPTYPDVPTTAELGYPMATGSTFGVFAPGETPDDIVETLNVALLEALTRPEVKDRLEGLGLTINGLPVEDSMQYYLDEIETFRQVVEEANIPLAD